MMPPAGFEMRLLDAVVKAVKDGLSSYPNLMEFQYPGTREIANASEEWLEVHPMTLLPDRRNRLSYQARYMFQVSCFSVIAEHRVDKDAKRPWTMAGIVRPLLFQKDLQVWDYDANGLQTSKIGVLSVHECDAAYVGRRSADTQRQPNRLGVGMPMNTHFVALTFRANANTN